MALNFSIRSGVDTCDRRTFHSTPSSMRACDRFDDPMNAVEKPESRSNSHAFACRRVDPRVVRDLHLRRQFDASQSSALPLGGAGVDGRDDAERPPGRRDARRSAGRIDRRPCQRTNAQRRSMRSAEWNLALERGPTAGSPRALTSRSAAESGTSGCGVARAKAAPRSSALISRSSARGTTSASSVVTESAPDASRSQARRAFERSAWLASRSSSGIARRTRSSTRRR